MSTITTRHHPPAAWLPVVVVLTLAATAAPAQTTQPPAPTLQVAATPAAARPLLDEAGALLSAGQAAEAYALLAPRELEFAGVPEYDYLLGVATLDSGRPAGAIFTLERLLAAEPGFDGARMELARAHYEVGDLESARTQFAYLRGRAPPAETRQVIDRYLESIDRRVGGRSQRWSGYLEAGAGWDSNANGSTADEVFLGFELDPSNIEQDSAFFDLAGGILHQAGYGQGLFSDAGLRGYYRVNPDARFVDQALIGGAANLYRSTGGWTFQGGVNGYYGWLDGSSHEAVGAVTASVARLLAAAWELRLQASGGPVRYQQDALEILDVNRYLGALSLTRYLTGVRSGRVALTLLGGQDDEKRTGSPYGNRRLGARLVGELAVLPRVLAFLQLGYLNTDYDSSPGFFGTDRDDDQYTALGGVEIRDWPAAGWAVAPRVRYTNQDSNVSLYDYDRVELAVTVRRAFR